MNIKHFLISLLFLGLTGCGAMNSNFSCDTTAGDSCLTIEQVDAMTSFTDEVAPGRSKRNMMKAANSIKSNEGSVAKMRNGQSIWVARKVREQSWA